MLYSRKRRGVAVAQKEQSEGGFLSEILALGILVVLGLATEIGGVIGVVVFVGYMAAVLYREFRLGKAREESGKVHTQFHQVGHENGDVDPSQESEIEDLATPGIIATTIAAGLGGIIGILLAIYIVLTPAFWFFCSMAEGQSCGVEIVFWPIGFFR
jgi:hypothetical protein